MLGYIISTQHSDILKNGAKNLSKIVVHSDLKCGHLNRRGHLMKPKPVDTNTFTDDVQKKCTWCVKCSATVGKHPLREKQGRKPQGFCLNDADLERMVSKLANELDGSIVDKDTYMLISEHERILEEVMATKAMVDEQLVQMILDPNTPTSDIGAVVRYQYKLNKIAILTV